MWPSTTMWDIWAFGVSRAGHGFGDDPGCFRRTILSSGTMVGIGLMPYCHQQPTFNACGEKFLRLNLNSGAVNLLRFVAVNDLVQQVTSDISHPLIDGEWIFLFAHPDVTQRYRLESALDQLRSAFSNA